MTVPAGARSRAAWLATTALTMLICGPAHAQSIGPDTTPQGGSVVGGSASISQNPGSTLVDQNSARAAINWQTFNVGSAAKVQFVQPSASAIALNRVVTANPSIIAGRIDANGQIVLINQSGVVFTKGSQVNAESIFVTTSDIATKDFMAGQLNFSGAPAPGAKIENDGQLTAKQAGLVGLVAPQVINNGVITATLGQVVLAGASAFTLDLYGDQLISLDVTRAVSEVDIGGKLVPGLVTNQGIILADGGKITLTAMDADALVTALIQAGGTLRTDSVGAAKGAITLQAVGGDIQIAGNLLARGQVAGTAGGTIVAAATGTITAGPGALADASGDAGGGLVSVGNALGAVPKAAAVGIAAGAVLKADATGRGAGGSVLLNSTNDTDFQGSVSVQGGAQGGNGGLADISSTGVISLGGTVLDTAIDGQAGEVLLDPATLVVTSALEATIAGILTAGGSNQVGTDASPVSYISPTALAALSGRIVMEATTLIAVASQVDVTGPLTLSSGGAVSIAAGVTSGGALEIDAPTSITIDAPLTAGTVLSLSTNGAVTQGADAAITAPTLIGSVGALELTDPGNAITLVGNLAGTGDMTLANSTSLNIAGTLSGGNITLAVNNSIGLNGALNATLGSGNQVDITAAALTIGAAGTIQAPLGTIAIAPFNGGVLDVGGSVAGALNLAGNLASAFDPTASLILGRANGATATTLLTTGSVSVPDATLAATTLVSTSGALIDTGNELTLSGGAVVNSGTLRGTQLAFTGTSFVSTGAIVVPEVSGSVSGNIALTGGNVINEIGAITAGGNITLDNTGPLGIGTVIAGTGSFALADTSDVTELSSGTIDVAEFDTDGGSIAGVLDLGGSNTIGALGNVSVIGALTLPDTSALTVAGNVAARNIALTIGGGLDVTGGLTATNGEVAIAAAAMTIGTAGTIAAPDGTIAIAPAGNGVLELGGTAAGTLGLTNALLDRLDPSAALTLGSAAGFVASSLLVAGSVSLGTSNAALSATTLIEIETTGTLTDTGPELLLSGGSLINNGAIDPDLLNFSGSTLAGAGTITAGTLSGSVTNGISLTGANLIGTLGAITAGGNITLVNGGPLAIGTVIASTGSFALSNSGDVTEGAGGTIDVAEFDSDGGSIGALDLGGVNAIGTLGGINAQRGITLADATSLDIEGLVTADSVTLVVDNTIGLNAPISGNREAIVAAGLTLGGDGSFGGDPDATIAIAPFNNGVLDIGGNVANALNLPVETFLRSGLKQTFVLGSAAGAEASTVLNAGELSFPGSADLEATTLVSNSGLLSATFLTLGGGAVVNSGSIDSGFLDATGSIFVSSGGVTAGTLSGSVTNGISLTGLNLIGTLGAINAGGNILLLNGESLAIGTVIAPSESFSLADTGPVTEQASGTIDVGEFDTDGTFIGGALSLNGTSNNIGTVNGVGATGAFSLVDAASLRVTGRNEASDVTLVLNGATSAVDVAGPISVASGHEIQIAADAISFSTNPATPSLTGALHAPSGTIALAPFSGTALVVGGSALLPNTLANLLIGPSLVDLGIAAGHTASAVTIDGSIAIDVATLALSAPSIALDGTIALGAVDTLSLLGTTVSEADAGAIDATYLTGSISNATLQSPLNAIGTLENLTATSLSLFDSLALTTDGTLDAGLLTLDDTGSVTEAATGTIVATTLSTGTGSIGGDLTLANTGNTILGISTLDVTGSIDIDFGGTVGTVQVSGVTSGNDITLTAGNINAGGISATNLLAFDVAGTIFLDGGITGGSVALNSGNGVFETVATAIITAGTLTGFNSASGNVSLASDNSIGTLAGYTLTGDDALILNEAAPLTITGSIEVPLGTFVLTGTGAVDETTGLIDATSLTTGTGSITADVSLAGANTIDTLAGFDVTGPFALNDTAPLGIGGTVSAPVFDLTTSGTSPVVETGNGAIDAGTFTTGTGSIAGDLSLTLGNSIGTFGNMSATGSIALDDQESVTTGSITGPSLLLSTTGSIILDGLISDAALLPASLVELDSHQGVSEASLGTIVAATLTGSNTQLFADSVSGDVDLGNANNIGTLGNYLIDGSGTIGSIGTTDFVSITGTGALTLNDDGNTAAPLVIGGKVFVPYLFSLADRQGVTETTVGSITGGGAFTGTETFDGGALPAGNVLLTGANELGLFTGVSASGDIVLDNDSAQLNAQHVAAASVSLANIASLSAHDITGGLVGLLGDPVDAGGVTSTADILISSASSITLDGQISAASGLTLLSGTGVTEATASGLIDAKTLTGFNSASGDISLASDNDIGTLGGYSLASDNILVLNEAALLVISGPVITGPVGAALGTFVLTGTGAVDETTGVIDAASLTTGTGSITADVTLTGANTIGTLGDFDVVGPGTLFALNDTAPFGISGTVSAAIFDLTTSGASPVAETGNGAIDAGTFSTGTGSIAGDLSLTLQNSIGTFGDVSATGSIALDDQASVTTGNITGPFLLLSTTGSIILDGLISNGLPSLTSVVELDSHQGVSEAIHGTIAAATLTGSNTQLFPDSVSGDVDLGNANDIGTLGNYTLDGLGEIGTIGATAFVSIAGTGSLTFNDDGDTAPLIIGGEVIVPDVFALTDRQGVTEATGGSITGFGAFTGAGTFDGGALPAGDVLLTGGNELSLFTGVSASGDIVLDNNTDYLAAQHVSAASVDIANAGSLFAHDIVGGFVGLQGEPVDAGGVTSTGDILISSASSITLDGQISAASELTLLSGTGVTEATASGVIDARTLSGFNSASGDVSLTSDNDIGTLSGYSLASNNALILNEAAPLVISGPVIAGPVGAAPGTFVLTGTGAVDETTGVIDAGSLTTGAGSIAADVMLAGANTIGTLGDFDVVGPGTLFALNDTAPLGVSGTVSAAIFDLTTSGTSPVAETGNGAINAGTFTTGTGSIAGDLSLTLQNSIATFGDVSAAGSIALDDQESVATGTITGPFVNLSTTGSIILDGLISDGLRSLTTLVALDTNLGVSEASAGTIAAATLTGSNTIGGDVVLGNPNTIATLAGYTLAAPGSLLLDDDGYTAPLAISGAVIVPDVFSLTDRQGVAETGAGSITGAGTFTSPEPVTGNVLLSGSNALSLFTGVSAAGDILLDNDTGKLVAQNVSAASVVIANTASLSAHDIAGGFVGLQGVPVDAGGVTSTGNIQISSASSIALDGGVSAISDLTLLSGTGVTETTPAGVITAGTLTGSNAGGDVSLASDNEIGTLGGYTLAGNAALILNQAAPLIIAGPVEIPLGTFVLTGTGAVDETAGVINANSLTTGAGTIAAGVTLTGDNSIGSLGNFDVTLPGALFALNDAAPLIIDGAVRAGIFALTDAAAVSQAGGAITAGTFTTDAFSAGNLSPATGSIGGGLSLGGSNDIDSLSRIAVGTFITLVNDRALTIAGGILAPQNFALENSGQVTETKDGFIRTAEFNSFGSLNPSGLLLTGGNSIASLGDVQAAGDIDLDNFVPLTIAGTIQTPGSFALGNAGGSVLETGGAIDAAKFDSAGTTIGGGITLAGLNNIGTLGAIHVAGDTTLVNYTTLVVTGPIVTNQLNLTETGQLQLLGSPTGGLFIDGATQIPKTSTLSTAADSTITIHNPSGLGLFEDGTFYINAGPDAVTYGQASLQPATLFIDAQNSTGVQFATYPDVLDATPVELELNAGLGTATGNVSISYLVLLQAGSANLTGTIGGVSGPPAAGQGTALPAPAPVYKFNACPIGSVNCVLLQLEALPQDNPLENFEVTVPKRRRLHARIILPGIATRDY